MTARGTALLLALLFGPGCAFSSFADPSGRQNALENAQQRYTQLMRWGELKKASAFVEPELREEFLGYAPQFEQIRITEYEAEEVNLDPSSDTATVEVTYYAYSLATFEVKKIQESQKWSRRGGVANHWFVRPEIEGILGALGADTH